MKKHFKRLRSFFSDFGAFLFYVIKHNQCDKHTVNHFKHSANNYMFQKNYEAFQKELQERHEKNIK